MASSLLGDAVERRFRAKGTGRRDIRRCGFRAPTVVARAREQGVLVVAFGPRTIRAVTHLDVTGAQCRRAGEVLRAARDGRRAGRAVYAAGPIAYRRR